MELNLMLKMKTGLREGSLEWSRVKGPRQYPRCGISSTCRIPPVPLTQHMASKQMLFPSDPSLVWKQEMMPNSPSVSHPGAGPTLGTYVYNVLPFCKNFIGNSSLG